MAAALLIGLLAAGYAILLFAPFQIRRSWEMPWLPFGIGSWRIEPWQIRVAWVPA